MKLKKLNIILLLISSLFGICFNANADQEDSREGLYQRSYEGEEESNNITSSSNRNIGRVILGTSSSSNRSYNNPYAVRDSTDSSNVDVVQRSHNRSTTVIFAAKAAAAAGGSGGGSGGSSSFRSAEGGGVSWTSRDGSPIRSGDGGSISSGTGFSTSSSSQ